MNNKEVVIIGAGVGGIATSIFLARNGFKVKVFEKNAFPGGRCSQMTHNGHRFDMGATIYLMPSVYKTVFEAMGITEESFKTTPLSTIYTVYFEDGHTIPFSTDKETIKKHLEKIEKGSFKRLQQYVSEGYMFFKLSMKKLIGRNFYKITDFINLSNILLLLRLKTYRRHSVYIKKYFRDEHLRVAFTFQNIYVGQDPLKAPALFSMIPASELAEGSAFPIGGMSKITETLISMAEKLGVQFFYKSPVLKIITNDNKAEGIILKSGQTAKAEIIVANADLPYVYCNLLPASNMAVKMNRLKYTCSAIVIHWGLDKEYSLLGHHSVFLSSDYRRNLAKIFREHAISENPSFYVHAPSRTDHTAAPKGGDTLTIIIPSGNINSKQPQDWQKLKQIARSAVIKRLKKQGLDDIEEHIKFEMIYLPTDWHDIFNLSKGATFGSLSHHIFQMGYFRPHNRHKQYKNLYFVGGGTHPGNGIPLVLLSAKLVTERIFRENSF
jgi:phytoene desaturase